MKSAVNGKYELMSVGFDDEFISFSLREKEYKKFYEEISVTIPNTEDNKKFVNTLYRVCKSGDGGVDVEVNTLLN